MGLRENSVFQTRLTEFQNIKQRISEEICTISRASFLRVM